MRQVALSHVRHTTEQEPAMSETKHYFIHCDATGTRGQRNCYANEMGEVGEPPSRTPPRIRSAGMSNRRSTRTSARYTRTS